jgi:hypothetical protein
VIGVERVIHWRRHGGDGGKQWGEHEKAHHRFSWFGSVIATD